MQGVVDGQGRGVGLFDDALPTSEELSSLGLSVACDYRPEYLQTYGDDREDDHDDEDDTPGLGRVTW